MSCSAPASHVQEDDDEEETHGAEAVMAAKAGWSSDMRLNESEEEEKGSLVDEDEEDDEVGVSLRMLLGGLWYGMVLLMAAAGLVVMLPHIYMAMPRCEAWCQGYHVVASVESGKRCEDLCGDVSGTVAALVEQTRELVHEIMSIVLPLPSQPGTEQYWDVRLRRSLRRLLAPASVHKSDMSALLLLPCRELPLQHLCNLTSEWGHVRLGWHLDMMHQVLDDQRKRSTLQEQHSDPTSAHRSTKLASINDPQPAQQCRGQDTHGAWRGREGRGAGGKGSGGGGGVGQRRRSGAHASTYDRLCQKQFGQGAAFDGEMCACKAGVLCLLLPAPPFLLSSRLLLCRSLCWLCMCVPLRAVYVCPCQSVCMSGGIMRPALH